MTSVLEVLTDKPQTKRALAFLLGWSPREVELEILRVRMNGVPVISTGDGYYLAQSAKEVAECAARLRRRAATQFLTARALSRAAERMEQRSTLWDVA